MPNSVINNQTEENIKNYLSEDDKNSMSDLDSINEKKYFKSRKFILAFLLLLIIGVVALFYFMRNKGKESFDDTQVRVRIEAPKEITSGEELVFNINYENKTSVDLKNVKIFFYFPKNFLYISSERDNKVEEAVLSWDIEKIAAGETGNIKMFGRVLGSQNSVYEFKSRISYTPENFNYEFSSSDDHSAAAVTIKKVPFILSVNSPEVLTVGEKFEYAIDFENISDYVFKFLQIRSNLPQNFACDSVDSQKIEENDEISFIFDVNDFSAGASEKILIKCLVMAKLNKNVDNKTSIVLEASEDGEIYFEYANVEISTIINEIPIEITQSVNGSTDYLAVKGEDLIYMIKFKNIGEQEIRGLVINSELTGKIDFDSIDVNNGSYDKNTKKITWSAFNVPKLASLAPGEEGEVSFRVNIVDYIEIRNPEEKHFSINNIVTISNFNFNTNSANVERKIASNNSVTKLNASLFLRSKGYFNDDGRIKNTGAIPPEVDQETQYLIHWNLSSLLNDISSIRITSVLPENVNWTGSFIKSNGEISIGNQNNGVFIPEETDLADEELNKEMSQREEATFNSIDDTEKDSAQIIDMPKEEKFYYNTETREVIWEIPLLDANTGVSSPVKEVVFQVSIKPKDSDIGNIVKITEIVRATGFDDFTKNEIEAIDIELTSELPDDYSIGINEGIVISNTDIKEKENVINQ